MIKIGITGQAGFVGTHLFNTLGLYPSVFERIPFKDSYFQNEEKLNTFVSQCDAIVHLAAMNRHKNPNIIYKINIGLINQLIAACELTNSKPHILFSSSIQEEKYNIYGKSKKDGRELLIKWAEKNHANFTGLIIPNVFGPFGLPNYNSVVATFCHQLTHNETPKIDIDGEIKLIYVSELVQIILQHITNQQLSVSTLKVPNTSEIKVSELLQKLTKFKVDYFTKGTIPNLNNSFELNLFNTFLCYIDYNNLFPFCMQINRDSRGSFVEIIKLNSGGQISFSTTIPDTTRGNHYHTRKVERFIVIRGKARIELRKIGTDELYSFNLDGLTPSFVDMPIWHTHNITNIGEDELYTIFWINEHYNSEDGDTYFEKV